ncbi:hypothetical protein, partial [uncultured Paracoccus sp.]|uniref:hypothetical protein n=1 Tax=uncultured Paracoccus sp. TaxID=189685 RepID=UPI00262EFD47
LSSATASATFKLPPDQASPTFEHISPASRKCCTSGRTAGSVKATLRHPEIAKGRIGPSLPVMFRPSS